MSKKLIGNRINRAYRFEPKFADFLADFSYTTGITQTALVEKAVLEYAQKNYPDLAERRKQRLQEDLKRTELLERALRPAAESNRTPNKSRQ